MTNLQKQIQLLEAQANEAELIAALPCEVETRRRNRVLAEQLRDRLQALARKRSQARTRSAEDDGYAV